MARVDDTQQNNYVPNRLEFGKTLALDEIYDRAMLPTRRELPTNNFGELVRILRTLPDLCPELGAVDVVATAQIGAHIFDATGGRNSSRRALELWHNADRGDGGAALLARAWRDFITAGWYVIGNDYDGGVIADVYHIDAAFTRFNTVGKMIGQRTYTPDDAPLIYTDNGDVPILRDPDGRWTEAWWNMMAPRSRREIKRSSGWWPSAIPLHRAYDLIRTITLARAVKNAQMSGEAILKLAFVNTSETMLPDAEKLSDLQREKAKSDADKDERQTMVRASTTLVVTDVSAKEISLKEVVIREGMNVEEMIAAGDNAQIQLCALYGVNPLDVNPRLSGAGGLNEGTKAKVADDLREGRLIARFIKSFVTGWNQWTAPRQTESSFTFNDPRDEDRRIARMTQVITAVNTAKSAQLIDDQQAAMILDWEEIFPPGVIKVADGEIRTRDETEGDVDDIIEPTETTESVPAVQLPTEQSEPVADAVAKEHTGAMIALMLPTAAAKQVASAYGAVATPTELATPVEELHCTLAYLGKVDDIADLKLAITRALENVARSTPELTGKIGGVGAFAPSDSSENLVPVYQTLDSAALPELRHRVIEALEKAGWRPASEHGYVPHITLDYLPTDAALPAMPLTAFDVGFNTLTLMWGGERIDWLLSGNAIDKARRPARTTPINVKVTFSDAAEALFNPDVLFDEAAGALLGYPIAKASRTLIMRVAPNKLEDDDEIIDEVVGALEEFGRQFVDALVQRVPKVTGKLARTIKFMVTGRGTQTPALEIYAGNAERDEIMVRATNFGRRGFGPKDPAGYLAFPGEDGDMVYTKYVGPAAAQGWIEAAFADVTDAYSEMLSIIGKAKVTFIKVGGAKVENAPHIDGYREGGKKFKKARVIK
jgi:2'-5' RNA ligase